MQRELAVGCDFQYHQGEIRSSYEFQLTAPFAANSVSPIGSFCRCCFCLCQILTVWVHQAGLVIPS